MNRQKISQPMHKLTNQNISSKTFNHFLTFLNSKLAWVHIIAETDILKFFEIKWSQIQSFHFSYNFLSVKSDEMLLGNEIFNRQKVWPII